MAIEHYYLFATDTGLTLWQGDPSRLHQAVSFSADANGVAEFELLVDGHPNSQWHVLLDLQEEDYRIETIPHVNARDRARIVQRRLEQLYRESSYRSATLQGREESGRRDDRLLFAALTNPAPLDMWVLPLVKRNAQLVGVYSVALLTARHISKVADIPARALIVSRQTGSGLRQSYLADGSLRFSRLTVLDGDDAETLSTQLVADAGRARQFLASLRAVDRNEALQVVMLCSDTEQAALQAACPDTELIHYTFLPLDQVAATYGVVAEPHLAAVEPLWLRFIASKHPSNQYATHEQRKPYQAWRLGRWLGAAALVLLLMGLLAGAYFFQASRALRGEVKQLEQRRQAAEQTYAANVPKLKEGELTPSGMRNVVHAYRELVEQWPLLANSLKDVSKVLAKYPMLELDEMAWMVSTDRNALPEGFADANQAAPAGAAMQPAIDANGNPVATGAAQRYVVLGLKGRLVGYEHRYRQALALVDELAQAFASKPDIKVDKLVLPLDTRPESHIELGNEASQDAEGAPFSLKISLPLPAAPAPAPAQEATP